MFDSIKEAVNRLVNEEIEKRRVELINNDKFKKGKLKADIEFLDPKSIEGYNNNCLCEETIEFMFREPHFQYKVDDGDPDDDRHYTIKAWLSEDLNRGVVASIDSHDGESEAAEFKVHRRGKHGRGVKCYSLFDSEKNFLKHYDDFVAEIVLLGLDDTSTESKE